MAEEVVSSVALEHLRAIRGDIAALGIKLDHAIERLTLVESGLLNLTAVVHSLLEGGHAKQVQIDQLAERIERIEHSLELREKP
jgi:hypothetical protein